MRQRHKVVYYLRQTLFMFVMIAKVGLLNMTELALEQITKAVCLVCGDKLAPFELETSICVLCED